MKNLNKIVNRRNALTVLLMLLTLAFATTASARDPFSPFSSSSEKKTKSKKSDSAESDTESTNAEKKPTISISNPLVTAPLDNYKLAAVMLTPRESYAVIRAPNGMQYIAQKNDRVGNEGGKISDITIDNIKIKNADDEVKIPVSNFAEAISVEEKELTP